MALEDLAQRVAELMAARIPSRATATLDNVVIALFFYLLTLIGPAPLNSPEAKRPPALPPIVRPTLNPAPVVDIDVNITTEQQRKAPTRKPPHQRERQEEPGACQAG